MIPIHPNTPVITPPAAEKQRHHIFLIPGFFGFSNIGKLNYFDGVAEVLTRSLSARGFDVNILTTDTKPTASLPKRVAGLADLIALKAPGNDPIHLIGHSTGGLDARLLTTPAVALPTLTDIEILNARIKSVVTVATPHHGAPLASFFVGMMGQKLLRIIAVLAVYVARYGKLHISIIKLALRLLITLDDTLGLRETVLDRAFSTILSDTDAETRAAFDAFFNQVHQDRALLTQLTPEGMELLNATVANRPSIRYGSVVTCARRPVLRSRLTVGFDPYAQLMFGFYKFLWNLNHTTNTSAIPSPSPSTLALLQKCLGHTPSRLDSDGIVPTWSQLHGDLISAVIADHGDITGHFGGPHLDLLSSGSGFSVHDFSYTWNRIAAWIIP